MTLEITELKRDPENKVYVHAYNVEGNTATLESGERIKVQTLTPGVTLLLDETVPEGKRWTNIHFQFQAEEIDA